MRRNYQGGSLAGFIIIAVLLGLVLAGGLYGLNRYNAQKIADETSKTEEIAREEAKTDDTSQTKTDESKSTDDDGATANTGDQTRTDDASDSPAPSTPGKQLPQTGPTDGVLTLVVVTLLTFASAHYLRSRQA